MATVLPQAACFASQVEVVVSDNASTDATSAVLSKYAEGYAFRTHRNPQNIGLLGNITLAAGSLATAEYVWLLGDDDLLVQGAIAKVVEMLEAASRLGIDLVALNVGYFPHTRRPLARDAVGGIDDVPSSQLRQAGDEGFFAFERLLEGPCADFTAMYAAIVSRRLWVAEFPRPIEGEAFTGVRNTYPHALLIAQHLPGKRAGVIAAPLVCNYEMPAEQFSWSKFHALTVVLHATALLKLFESNGVPREVLRPYYLYQLNNRGGDLGDLCWNRQTAGGWPEALRFAWMMRRYPLRLLKLFVIGCADRHAPMLLRYPLQWLLERRVRRAQLAKAPELR